jgi:iron complex outermembrane receptor protein
MRLAGFPGGRIHTALLALALAGLAATAPAGELELERLKSLSLDELADIEVWIASRRPERVADIPAAVHVVTADDIRRSGATAIPEVLRMVPGVQVARIDANKWAVSIRGFNGIFSNKLLVLIDGRTVYSPSFSGVFWDIQDTLLEDIERIEVIRGPGASVWGANAVNGVINVVTRSAAETVGGLVSAGAGNEQAYLGVRQGVALGEGTFLRAYAKVHRQDAGVFAGGKDATDDWTQGRLGFRLDRDSEDGDALTLQGELYRQDAGQRRIAPDLTRYAVVHDDDINRDGAFLLARWRRAGQDGSARELEAYLDYVHMDQPYRDYRQYMFEVDYSHLQARLGRHEITWGLSLRLSQDDLAEDPILPFDPEDRFDQLYGAFVQDQITLVEDRLLLTVGSKIEHNDYTGFEVQPTARLLWRLDPDHSLWASVSRAVRTPSRIEHDGALFQSVRPPSPAPAPPLATAVRFEGDRALDSESLVAYELGYRGRLGARLSVDVAAFHNDYDRLRSTPLAFVTADASPPPPHLTAHFVATNEGAGHTYGVEVAADWRATERWRVQGAITWLEMAVDSFPSEESRSPDNHYSLRSQYALREDLDFDLWLRHVGELRAADQAASDVGDYTTLDARLSWQATRDLNLSLVGRNLLGASHLEFDPDFLPYVPAEVQREVLVQVRWDF